MTRTLLIVDDEPHVSRGLSRLLHRHGYQILEAGNAWSGLDLLERYAIGVVISDYRMPGMQGVDFLAEVRRRSPATYRIMLTGQANIETVIAAINEGAVHKFLLKPWKPAELEIVVEESFRHHELIVENQNLTAELEQANHSLRIFNRMLAETLHITCRELNQATYFDPVTRLPNRLMMLQYLKRLVSHPAMASIAVVVLGLDGFRLVNNHMSARLGDELLRRMGERLVTAVPEAEIVARLGNDEFCLILAEQEGVDVRDRIHTALQCIAEPVEMAGRRLCLSACAGVALSPAHGNDPDTLLGHADAALREAKRRGSGTIYWFDAVLDQHGTRGLLLMAELQQALRNGEFALHLQPKVSLTDGRIVGAEALLRWRHPQRGLVSPGEFLQVLENSGLIFPVGEWVIEETCRMIQRLRKQGIEIPLAINLSVRQFQQEDLIDVLVDRTERHGLTGIWLPELEITEHVLMQELERGQVLLQQLHQLGFRLALDDFGTGYSSLSYLAHFPIDVLKIDCSFVRHIGEDGPEEVIITMITDLARSLDLDVVAEGVETEDQRAFLSRAGCSMFQGYLASPPLPEADFVQLVQDAA